MKTSTSALILAALASSATAKPFHGHRHRDVHTKREVPQEHSHEFVLTLVRTALQLDNPNEIADPVFGLLGNAAAIAGLGKLTDPDCLQMETADQAFTNAKAAGDVDGMAAALMFRAIERNTGGVGVASVICSKTPVNPEIAALSQHQDPASDNAATINKGIALELAKQLAACGSDPLLALETGTFAPGDKADATGKGNSCDTQPDDVGCIFTEKKLVLDATPDEISAAVVGVTPTASGGTLSATHIDFAGLPVATGAGAVDAGAGAGNAGQGNNTDVGAGAGQNNGNNTETGQNNNNNGKNNGKGNNKGKNGNGKKNNNGKGNNGKNNNNNGGAAATTTAAAAAGTEACAATTAAPAPAATQSCSTVVTTVPASVAATMTGGNGNAGAAQPTDAAAAQPAGTNVQAFTGTLGGPAPPVVSGTGNRPFTVNGNTFVNAGAALARSCDIQKNACANAANSGALAGGVAQCEQQKTDCDAANPAVARRWLLVKRQAASDFGSCSDPTIVFSSNNADRQGEAAFIASNQGDFNHGSALKIGVISDFICQRLNDQCKAPADVVAACTAASTAAKAAQQDQAAADVFNAFAGGAGAGAGAGNGAGAAQSTTTSAAAAVTTAAPQSTDCAVQEQMVVVTLTQCA